MSFFEGSVQGFFQREECRFEEIGKQFFFQSERGCLKGLRERALRAWGKGAIFFNHRATIFYITRLLIFFHHQAAIFFNHRAVIFFQSPGCHFVITGAADFFSSLGCSSIIASTPRLSWCFPTHPSPHQLHTTFSVSSRLLGKSIVFHVTVKVWLVLVELLLYCVVWLTLQAPTWISLNMATFNFYIYGFACYNEGLMGFWVELLLYCVIWLYLLTPCIFCFNMAEWELCLKFSLVYYIKFIKYNFM